MCSDRCIYSCNPNINQDVCCFDWKNACLGYLNTWFSAVLGRFSWGSLEEVWHWDLKVLPTSFALSASSTKVRVWVLCLPHLSTMMLLALWEPKSKQTLLYGAFSRSVYRSNRKVANTIQKPSFIPQDSLCFPQSLPHYSHCLDL